MPKWEDLTLKQQLLSLLSAMVVVTLCTFISISYGFHNSVNNDILDTSRNIMESQVGDNTESTIDAASSQFQQTMDQTVQSFLLINCYAAGNAYKSGYPMSPVPSYFEYGTTYFAQPLTTDDRYGDVEISLEHSSYYVPSATPYDIPEFDAELNATRDTSAHVDPFVSTGYADYTYVVAGYIGFEDGLFRHYPAVGTLETDPERSYDPRVRGWYTSAMDNPDEIVIDDPYVDFNGKGWMLSISITLRNAETSDIHGVCSLDMLIDIIREQFVHVSFLDTGKISLFQTDGTVVADREWDTDPDDDTLYTYADLEDPPISDSLWSTISSNDRGTIKYYTANGVEYMVSYAHNDLGYVMVAFIPKDEIMEPVDAIQDDVSQEMSDVMTLNVILFVVITIVVLAFVLFIVLRITRPVRYLTDTIGQMIGNIGKTRNIYNVEMHTMNAPGEAGRAVSGFTDLVNGLRTVRQEELDEEEVPVVNPFFGKINDTAWAELSHPDTLRDIPIAQAIDPTTLQPIVPPGGAGKAQVLPVAQPIQ